MACKDRGCVGETGVSKDNTKWALIQSNQGRIKHSTQPHEGNRASHSSVPGEIFLTDDLAEMVQWKTWLPHHQWPATSPCWYPEEQACHVPGKKPKEGSITWATYAIKINIGGIVWKDESHMSDYMHPKVHLVSVICCSLPGELG